MATIRFRFPLLIGVIVLISSCGSAVPLSDDEVAECAGAVGGGSLGGRESLVSVLVLGLPDEAIPPSGTPAEEIEAAFDLAFSDMYGIHVDEFLALRDEADTATTDLLGVAPGVGERVSNEWFVQRDMQLLALWNERYPVGARAYCELVLNEVE